MKCIKCNYTTPKQAQLDRHYANTGHHRIPKTTTYVAIGKMYKKVRK